MELTGPNNCIFAAIDLGKLDAQGAASSLDFLELVKQESSTEPTPTPTTAPTPTPTTEPTPTPTYVPGDADEWTGKFSEVESHKNGYVGEIYAMTTFTKTNGSSSVAGVDYKATASSPFGSNGSFTMVVGDWGQYEVTVPYTGVYAMQVQTSWIGGSGNAQLMVAADTGYYSIHNLAHAT